MLLVYGMTRATQHGWGTPATIGLLTASAVLIASFFLIESRTKAPLLPLRILRLRTLAGSNLSALIATGAVFSQFFLLTLYMQQVLHYSALKTGVAYIGLTVTTIALSAVAQALVTRLGVRSVLPVGLALSTVALVLFARLPDRLLRPRRHRRGGRRARGTADRASTGPGRARTRSRRAPGRRRFAAHPGLPDRRRLGGPARSQLTATS